MGTVAVAVTMISLEVADYCEEKQQLQEDANILYGTQTEFDLQQCIEGGKEDSRRLFNQPKNSSVKAVRNVFTSKADFSADRWAAIKEANIQALQTTGKAASSVWDAAISWVTE